MRAKGNNIFVSFLELLNVKHTREFSGRYFHEHPHKYNLFGISKMLSDYGIANAGTKIENKDEEIFNIELPFIAHFGGGDFVIVYKIEQEKVWCIWNEQEISLSLSEFIDAWSGVILLAETSKDSIEPNYKVNRKKEILNAAQTYMLLFAGGLLLLLAYIRNSLFADWGLTLLLLLNFAGIYIGYLLVQKQLRIHSKYADKICSLFKQSDCNNVLESKAAKLWGVFGWSEIGLGYFSANALILLFLPQLVSYVAILNIFALLYSVWSVWYQKFKAKQWCALCLIVQILFWLVFATNLTFGFIQMPDFNMANWLLLGCIFVFPILGFNILIPKISKERLVQHLKQEINSLKADDDVFKVFLKKQTHYEVDKSDSQIRFGNSDANLQITILTNPFCYPCAMMHKRIEKLLKAMDEQICIQYIFSSFEPSLDFANKYLIAAFLVHNTDIFRQIIGDWFDKGKLLKEQFFKDLHLSIDSFTVETEFQKHEMWRGKTQIRGTPTILVNGYQLPENYKIEDLRYFTKLEIDVN
ncbi:hypothetical protein AGMMS4957_03760 [Bacteroidia bacterium]|nr:hypothetical protein AGMMS4957_03520 [Bacteroidia bacterium]GHT19459.1 hypothetical protein AGMMS4957_03760 [Bacteroidia bacterium]